MFVTFTFGKNCRECINYKTMKCPNSSECFEKPNKPYFEIAHKYLNQELYRSKYYTAKNNGQWFKAIWWKFKWKWSER